MEEKTELFQMPEAIDEHLEFMLKERDINVVKNETNLAKDSTAAEVLNSAKKGVTPRKPLLTALALEANNGENKLVQKQVFHSGVPVHLSGPSRHTTVVKPFSFEERNKEAQRRKQEKLKKIKEETEKQPCTTFKARPVPAYLKQNRI